MFPTAKERIIVALDVPTVAQAKDLVEKCTGFGLKFKVGNQLFTVGGPEIVHWIKSRGEDVFLDLKFLDIGPVAE